MSSSVQYLTDAAGEKMAVVLPLAEYERLLEDLADLAAVAERKDEPTIDHDAFMEKLKRDGLL